MSSFVRRKKRQRRMKSPYIPSSREAWWLLTILAAGAVISYMHRLVLGVLVGPVSADLALTDTEISLLQGAAFAIIYVFAGLPLGRLADRGNRRNLIKIGRAHAELQSLMRISYAVFCLKKKNTISHQPDLKTQTTLTY